MIPGNERGILRVQDELSRRGCRVMTATTMRSTSPATRRATS
jgi:hypothetical protein